MPDEPEDEPDDEEPDDEEPEDDESEEDEEDEEDEEPDGSFFASEPPFPSEPESFPFSEPDDGGAPRLSFR